MQGANVYYGNVRALQDWTMEVEEGSVTCVLGRNGAGKSTCMEAIIGVRQIRGGEIVYEGRRIDTHKSYKRAALGIAYVPQDRGIFGNLSVERNLTVVQHRNHTGPWTLQKVYEMFPRLEERKQNYGVELSGGEQQMLAIARALLLNPKLLLLDEPSEGLAPLIVRTIIDVLRTIQSTGVTIVLIEQRIKVAMELGDVFYMMKRGRNDERYTREAVQRSGGELIEQYFRGA